MKGSRYRDGSGTIRLVDINLLNKIFTREKRGKNSGSYTCIQVGVPTVREEGYQMVLFQGKGQLLAGISRSL